MLFQFVSWLFMGAKPRRVKTSPLVEFINFMLLFALLGVLGRCRG